MILTNNLAFSEHLYFSKELKPLLFREDYQFRLDHVSERKIALRKYVIFNSYCDQWTMNEI